MKKEQNRLEAIISDKDSLIAQQRHEINQLLLSSGGSNGTGGGGGGACPRHHSPGSSTSLDRHRAGAARVHGSFRQYKREKRSSAAAASSTSSQQVKIVLNSNSSSSSSNATVKSAISSHNNNSDGMGSLGSTSLSSEENSSPNSTPKNTRPPLRLTLSTPDSSPESQSKAASSSANNKPKGILKVSSSYGSLDSNASTSIIENLQRLINAKNQGPMSHSSHHENLQQLIKANKASSDPVAPDDSSPAKTFSTVPEEKSDSGRESDESNETGLKKKLALGRTGVGRGNDSGNSSFDATHDSSLLHFSAATLPSPVTMDNPPPPREQERGGGLRLSIRSMDSSTSSSTSLSPSQPPRADKPKPKPPPRSSTTKLTNSIRRPNVPAKPNMSGNPAGTNVINSNSNAHIPLAPMLPSKLQANTGGSGSSSRSQAPAVPAKPASSKSHRHDITGSNHPPVVPVKPKVVPTTTNTSNSASSSTPKQLKSILSNSSSSCSSGSQQERQQHHQQQPQRKPKSILNVSSVEVKENATIVSVNQDSPSSATEMLLHQQQPSEFPPSDGRRIHLTRLSSAQGQSRMLDGVTLEQQAKEGEGATTTYHNKKAEKRVTFQQEVQVKQQVKMEQKAIMLLEESIKNYKPVYEESTRFGSDEEEHGEEGDDDDEPVAVVPARGSAGCLKTTTTTTTPSTTSSYYEPYI